MPLFKQVGDERVEMTSEEEAATRADWARNAVTDTTDAEDNAAAELGKWYERKRRNALTRVNAPQRFLDALVRLDAECDANIARLEA